MQPILTITPNPSIDRTLLVPQFEAGQVFRAKACRLATGGKGVNVARTLAGCGRATLALGWLGGHSGRLAAELAHQHRLPARWTWSEAETRTCTVIVGDDGRHVTVINEEGPVLKPDDWERFAAMVTDTVSPGDLVGLCGSVPSGVAPGAVRRLAADLVEAGARLFVDMTGPPLVEAAAAAPEAIKINAAEAGDFLDQPVTPANAAAAAGRLSQATGAAMVAITLGEDGAVLAAGDALWQARVAPVRAVSAVGSGDAFLAGLFLGLDAGLPADAVLARAVAAGTANALAFGGGEVGPDTLARVESTVTVRRA